jgi:hypothetical protein
MNRLAGIITAAIGLLIAVLSLAGVIPGLTGAGVSLILLGALVFGLSFVPKPDPNDTERMSTPATLVNIFFSPSEVFQNLRRHPRWLVAVLIMSILSAVYYNAFLYRLTPELVTNYSIDKTLEMPMMNAEARQKIEANRAQTIADNKNPLLRGAQAVNGFVGKVFLYAFYAVIFFLFALAMGGQMNYWQAFAAAVYAYFPLAVIRFILNTVILFVKDPVEIHPVLGAGNLIQDNLNFLVLPSEHPVIYTILSLFGVLAFIWIWFNATGLKNTAEKITPTIAWAATLTIFFFEFTIAIIGAYFFSGFMK